MAMERRCPTCDVPLQIIRQHKHRKLRCPKCRTFYPIIPEAPDLLRLPLFLWLCRIRWAVLLGGTVAVLVSTRFFTNSVSHPVTHFWTNTILVVAYATGTFTYLHWYLY